MNWFFNRKKQPPALVVAPPPSSRVEIELHKGATEEAAEKARQVNEHLKHLYEKNGFTITIYLAAGGQPPKKKR